MCENNETNNSRIIDANGVRKGSYFRMAEIIHQNHYENDGNVIISLIPVTSQRMSFNGHRDFIIGYEISCLNHFSFEENETHSVVTINQRDRRNYVQINNTTVSINHIALLNHRVEMQYAKEGDHENAITCGKMVA